MLISIKVIDVLLCLMACCVEIFSETEYCCVFFLLPAKWFMLPNGDLYVFNVDIADGYKTFACRTSHKLTNEAKTSKTSRIIIKGKFV